VLDEVQNLPPPQYRCEIVSDTRETSTPSVYVELAIRDENRKEKINKRNITKKKREEEKKQEEISKASGLRKRRKVVE